jgi:RNA polymerase sigma-70 factor (ECF subfamily)
MPAFDSTPDEALLTLIAAGDAEALTALFRRRQQNVYRFALHLTGSATLADDVTQDVFIAVIRDASRFEAGRATAMAWLCGIARNHVRRRLEAERGAAAIDDESLEAALPVVHPDPLADLTQAERLESLQKAILSLPLRYREVVVLCDLQEMPYADAAAALGCVIGTVRSRLHRARALLTAKMQAEQRTDGMTGSDRMRAERSGRGDPRSEASQAGCRGPRRSRVKRCIA